MNDLFSDLSGFLEELEASLATSETGLYAAVRFLGNNADPHGNLGQTIKLIQNSKGDISNFRENLHHQIDISEDRDIAEAIKAYLNGEL
jgi:hypothetical protein